MADSWRQGSGYVSGRVERDADDVTDSYTACTFTTRAGDSVTWIDAAQHQHLCVLAEETAEAQSLNVKIQVRNEPDDTPIDLATETAVTAGTVAEVFDGVIRYREFRILAEDTSTAGSAAAISFCLSR